MTTNTIRKRRRHAPEFKASVVAACLAPGASVARIAREHDLNANLVQTWIRKARQQSSGTAVPAFVPLGLPASLSAQAAPTRPDQPDPAVIGIDIPAAHGTLRVHWPLSAADQCATWLKALLA